MHGIRHDLNGYAVIGTGSTTGLKRVQQYVVQFTEPDLAGSSWVNSTYTVSGLTTNSVVLFTARMPLAAGYVAADVRCSTADELVIRWENAGGSTISGATNRAILLEFAF